MNVWPIADCLLRAFRTGLALAGLMVVAGALAAPDVSAHARSRSSSDWVCRGGLVQATVRIGSYEVTRLRPVSPLGGDSLEARLGAELSEQVRVFAQDDACGLVSPWSIVSNRDGLLFGSTRFDCRDAAPTHIEYRAMLEAVPAHTHFLRVRTENGPMREVVLTGSGGRILVSGEPLEWWDEVGRYIRLGAEHIFDGVDHLMFLLALVLVSQSLAGVLGLVSGFTLGHAATLVVAAFGWIHGDESVIEVLIGFTVALAGAEAFALHLSATRSTAAIAALGLVMMAALSAAVLGRIESVWLWFGLAVFASCYLASAREFAKRFFWRLCVSMIFGFVHGLAFAGVLLDLDVRSDALVPRLLGFNVGVELGQLAWVFVAVLGVQVLVRVLSESRAYLVFGLAGGGICSVGVFWMLVRSGIV